MMAEPEEPNQYNMNKSKLKLNQTLRTKKKGGSCESCVAPLLPVADKELYMAQLEREGVSIFSVPGRNLGSSSDSSTEFEEDSDAGYPSGVRDGKATAQQLTQRANSGRSSPSNREQPAAHSGVATCSGQGSEPDKEAHQSHREQEPRSEQNSSPTFDEEMLASLSINQIMAAFEALFRALTLKTGPDNRAKFSACAEFFAKAKIMGSQQVQATPTGSASCTKRKDISPLEENIAAGRKRKKSTVEAESSHDNETAPVASKAGETWATVVKRRSRGKNQPAPVTPATPAATPAAQALNKAKAMARRGEAIALSIAGESFEGAVKKVRQSLKAQPEGLRRIRRSRAGEVLLEFEPKVDASSVTDELKKALGAEGKARHLTPTVNIEVLDIDPLATREEIAEAAHKAAGVAGHIDCRVLRSGAQGMQVAVICCPAQAAAKLLKEEKLKIGWMSSRLRLAPSVVRCFLCHGFGHLASQCTVNKKGVLICRRCGLEGHKLAECSAPPDCLLCRKKGYGKVDHTAGSLGCRVYKEHLASRSSNTSVASTR